MQAGDVLRSEGLEGELGGNQRTLLGREVVATLLSVLHPRRELPVEPVTLGQACDHQTRIDDGLDDLTQRVLPRVVHRTGTAPASPTAGVLLAPQWFRIAEGGVGQNELLVAARVIERHQHRMAIAQVETTHRVRVGRRPRGPICSSKAATQ